MVRTVKIEGTIKGAKGMPNYPGDVAIFTSKIANDNKDHLYTYVASIERVVDGDTLIVMIDLGLKTKTRQKLRLRGIDCPELTTERGKYTRSYVKNILDKQKFVIVKTYKDDKYGRMLADVFFMKGKNRPEAVAENGIFFNQILLNEGLAEIW